ncbi:unnamed protein product [Camellia sinensis]
MSGWPLYFMKPYLILWTGITKAVSNSCSQTKMYDVKGLTVGQGSFGLYALLALMAEARACLNIAGTGGALPVLIYEQIALCFVQALPVLIYEQIALCFVQALRLGISMQEI